MRESEILVNSPALFSALFPAHGLPDASKCAKIKDTRMYVPFSVRPVRASDLDRICEIEHASFGKDAYPRKLFAEFHRKCGGLFLVAERGRALWGYMVTCRSGDRAELVSVAVAPDARKRGAASALMDSTLRRLRRRGIARIRLMVRVRNRKARAFYEKYGFDKVRVVRGYYEDGADGLMMAREVMSARK
jgi:ribosomal-protein-alanine N-acetyltransferase